MRKRILFCDAGDGLGRIMQYAVRPYTIDVDLCPSNTETMTEALRAEHYDALIFAAWWNVKDICAFIGRVSAEHPDMLIYPIVDSDADLIAGAMCEAGAKRVIPQPISTGEICSLVADDLSPSDEKAVLEHIAEFLERKHFARYMHGFRFMCLAVEQCLIDPMSLMDLENRMYPYIAERMLTTPSFVERAIGQLHRNVVHKNWEYDGVEVDLPDLTDFEVIAASSDEYAKGIL